MEQLADLMARETFFRELPTINQHTRALEGEYSRRHAAAVDARVAAYAAALDQLRGMPGWETLDSDQQGAHLRSTDGPCDERWMRRRDRADAS